jgi:UDP:flavonoid glycosyltransferase YjiC (YdhE family)
MVPAVEALGFPAFPAGSDRGGIPERKPLVALDTEREERAMHNGFVRRIAGERARDILPLCDEWQPDVLVCEETDFGAMVVAERCRIPAATVIVIAAGSLVRKELIAEPLNELRAAYGLPPDPDLAMLSRHLVLSPVPPSFRDPAFPLPATAQAIRPFSLDQDDGPTPAWLVDLPAAPTVYVTLGTVFHVESGDLFSRLLAGLRDLPLSVVLTVGREIDPAELGPQPANVRVERWIPQAAVLPRCDLVVSHGGSGSVIGALAYGLPMVLLPMGADQPYNAARCTELGVGRVLDAVAATPETIREAVSAVLADPAYRRAAKRIREEIASLPGPEFAVSLLEGLVRASW